MTPLPWEAERALLVASLSLSDAMPDEKVSIVIAALDRAYAAGLRAATEHPQHKDLPRP